MDDNAETRVENKLHPPPTPSGNVEWQWEGRCDGRSHSTLPLGGKGGPIPMFSQHFPVFFSNIIVHDCLQKIKF